MKNYSRSIGVPTLPGVKMLSFVGRVTHRWRANALAKLSRERLTRAAAIAAVSTLIAVTAATWAWAALARTRSTQAADTVAVQQLSALDAAWAFRAATTGDAASQTAQVQWDATRGRIAARLSEVESEGTVGADATHLAAVVHVDDPSIARSAVSSDWLVMMHARDAVRAVRGNADEPLQRYLDPVVRDLADMVTARTIVVAAASVDDGVRQVAGDAVSLLEESGGITGFAGAAGAMSPPGDSLRTAQSAVAGSADLATVRAVVEQAVEALQSDRTISMPANTDQAFAAYAGALSTYGRALTTEFASQHAADAATYESARIRLTLTAFAAATALTALVIWRRRLGRAAEQQLRTAASTDPLTGLGNRAFLDAAVPALREQQPDVALLHIDLDHFKPVNDTYGHAVGDRVLVETAERLRSVAEAAGGVAARLGGDEFAVVLPAMEPAKIDELTRKMLDDLAAFEVEGISLQVGASIGIAQGLADVGPLLANADIALYEAKRTGRGQASTFRAEAADYVAFVQEQLVKGNVHTAYQPQIALRDGRCIGVEVLARLVDRSGSYVRASEWMGIAEWLGVTEDLFEHVITSVVRDLAHEPEPAGQIWFNLSAHDLNRPGGPDWVLEHLGRLRIPPARLGVEITSTSAVRNTDGLARAVSQLRSAGVGVALGDFGTHDTPLGHLVSLPVSRVKLDGSLTNGIRRDTPAAWVITAMTQLAARLRIEVIAEGITSGDQLAILPSLGVPAVQGYLLGLPGPLSRIPAAVDLAAVAQLNLSSIENRPGVGALVQPPVM